MKYTIFAVALACAAAPVAAQQCSDCATWNAPHAPLRLYGNTYFVGMNGLSAVLVTSPEGHVLIDGGLPESAARIRDNITSLGFRMQDVKLILNSHAHFDHAGGIADLQKWSGARVAASAASAREMRVGNTTPDDPQHGIGIPYPRVERIDTIVDGQVLRVGSLALTAHFTPGHTPGGTTWSWRSCEGKECRDFVYADSQTPVSRDDFHFTRSAEYPGAVADFRRGQAAIEKLSCDILVTPHPSASSLWERVAAGKLVDRGACVAYVKTAREALAKRLESERVAPF